ncbi:MAG: hypothetical protein AAF631_05610 [Pseudomonadota bacterium]
MALLAALSVASAAQAHTLVVFASVDCEAVSVEAKFSSGKVAQKGDVRILDGENTLLKTLTLGSDGTVEVPLADLPHGGGLLIEVDTGGHDNYWIITPKDIARKCGS